MPILHFLWAGPSRRPTERIRGSVSCSQQAGMLDVTLFSRITKTWKVEEGRIENGMQFPITWYTEGPKSNPESPETLESHGEALLTAQTLGLRQHLGFLGWQRVEGLHGMCHGACFMSVALLCSGRCYWREIHLLLHGSLKQEGPPT